MTSIVVTRSYLNKGKQARSLDTNFINTMVVLVSQRNSSCFPSERGWVAFSSAKGTVFRQVRYSRHFNENDDRLCVDHDFSRALSVDDGQSVEFRAVRWYDALRLWAWYRSLTPALRVAFWFAMAGVFLSSILGAFLGAIISTIWTD